MKKAILFIVLLIAMRAMNAQDPSFSQFFSSPLNVNPALTARINSDWRVISNFRDQWLGPASPYATGTISYDAKVLQNKIPNVHEEKNTLGLGGMLMYDYAMDGIMKSVYASGTCHIILCWPTDRLFTGWAPALALLMEEELLTLAG